MFVTSLIVALSATGAPAEPSSDEVLVPGALDTNLDADNPGALRASTRASALAPASVNNAFESLTPARLLDTRANSGTYDGQYSGVGPLGPGDTFELIVVGRGGVPSLGVGAVAINVTAVSPTGNGFLTVWPTGTLRPNASNLNFVANDVVPNMVVVRVGADGRISIFNEAGTTHLVVDIVGWFADNAGLQPLVPARLLDTRPGTATIDGLAAGGGAIGPDATTDLLVVGRGGVPATGVATVVLNITVTAPTAGGFATVWPSAAARPNASNLNFVPNQTVANMVITKVGPNGRINLYNSSGASHLIVDVMGWIGADSELTSLQPARLLDTRPGTATIDGQFVGTGAIGANASRTLVVVGRGGVPATGVAAVVLNVTVTAPTAPSFLTVWPTGFNRPNASSLNYSVGKTVANMVLARVGIDGTISFYNSAGAAHVIVDVVGWMPPNQPLALGYYNLLPGVVGQTYSQSLGINGSQGPYQVSASGVPPGLNLGGTGNYSGTPSKAGTTSTQIGVADRFGRVGVTTKPHNIFPASSGFVSVAPTTVLDTFEEPQPLAAGATRPVTVGGIGGVPATGVVPVLSVLVFGWDTGFVSLYPSGQSQPASSHFVVSDFEVVTDISVVSMGTNSQINVFTSREADLQIDVIGYMPLGGSFTPISPIRILDTRSTTSVAPSAQRDVDVNPIMGATDVLAIVATTNVTAVGSLMVWDKGATAPTAPTLRWDTPTKLQFVVIHLGADGDATIKNTSSSTSVDVIVDIHGYFT